MKFSVSYHDKDMELLLLCYEGTFVCLVFLRARGIANPAIEYREKKSSLV